MGEEINPWDIFPYPPRRWQREAYPIAMKAIRSKRRAIVQATTGAGKSWFIEAIVYSICLRLRPGYVVLVTVPTKKLVDQTAAGLRDRLPAGMVGRWYSSKKEAKTVIVCCQDSIGTLADELTIRDLKVAHWLADEVHRASTAEMMEGIDRLTICTRLGVTATPFRSCEDEALIGWEEVIYRYTIDQAIADGVLVPYRIYPWRGEDGEDATTATIELIKSHAPAGPGIVSAKDIKDAEETAEDLEHAGIAALPIHSRLSQREQKRRIAALLAGEVRCLVHVQMLVEGVDFPPLRWLAMRRPRKAAVGIVQEVGRVLRTMRAPDQWGEKREAAILLPHPTPILDSISREAALSLTPEEQAKKLRQAAEDELEPRVELDTIMPGASAVAEVGSYFGAIVEAMIEGGIAVEDRPPDNGWRSQAPKQAQISKIRAEIENKRKGGIKYLPENHRKVIRAVLSRPEVLTRGDCSDILTIIHALRRKAGEHYRRHASSGGNDRYWKGYRGILPDPPDVSAFKKSRSSR